MNFDVATITFPDGRVAKMPPQEFVALPLGERISLLTAGRIKFERDRQPISPLEAMRSNGTK